MLNIANATKTYLKKPVKAVDGLTLRVRPGEIYGFIGPNGAGKTTTIKMACGILSMDAGKIEIGGIDISEDPIQAKHMISFVPDSPDMPKKLKGTEYLGFMADMYDVGKAERTELIEKYSSIFDLSGALNDRIGSYSHGMQQKLAIIGALVSSPKLIILDEPMVGLDPKSSFALKEIMRGLCNNGAAVFFSTHVLDVAERFCDRVGIINHGKLIAEGTLSDLRGGSNESLEEIFLELTETSN